jgi:hypothetical protein
MENDKEEKRRKARECLERYTKGAKECSDFKILPDEERRKLRCFRDDIVVIRLGRICNK